jgi:hypothetical protein
MQITLLAFSERVWRVYSYGNTEARVEPIRPETMVSIAEVTINMLFLQRGNVKASENKDSFITDVRRTFKEMLEL